MLEDENKKAVLTQSATSAIALAEREVERIPPEEGRQMYLSSGAMLIPT